MVIMTEMQKKLGLLMPLVYSMKALPDLKKILLDVQESVEHVLERLTKQDCDIADITTRLGNVKASSSEKEVSEFNYRINDLEQYIRRQNHEIHGMKLEANENLLSKINEFGTSLGIRHLAEEDIHGVHRLSAKRGQEAPSIEACFKKNRRNLAAKG